MSSPHNNNRNSEGASSYTSPFSNNLDSSSSSSHDNYNNSNDPSSSTAPPYSYSYPYAYGSDPAPETSAGGRPTTSSGFGAGMGMGAGSGGRPGTAKVNPFRQQVYQEQYGFYADERNDGDASTSYAPHQQQHYQQQGRGQSRAGVSTRAGYGIDEQDEEEYFEEEESEDEGLFAFLPPSTAEQVEERERELRQQQQQQQYQQYQGHAAEHPVQGVGGSGGSGSSPFAYGVSTQHQHRQYQPPRTSSDSPLEHHPQQQLDRSTQADPGGAGAALSPAAVPGLPYPQPHYAYDPPQSPPSSDSNEESRAGRGVGAGDFRMTRLDGVGARRSQDEGDRASRKSGGSRRASRDNGVADNEQQQRRNSHHTTGAEDDVDAAERKTEALSAATTTVEAPPDTGNRAQEEEPKHFLHFQPNPARSNANSGPYKRHREYHHNQAYPQYAVASGNSVSSRLNTAATGVSSQGALPSTAGSQGPGYGYGSSYGYAGDYEDMERYRERKEHERESGGKSKKRRQRRSGTAGSTATATATASEMGYGAGSEYSSSYQPHAHQGRTTGINEVDEASLSKSMYYEGEDRESRDDMYDEDGEGYDDEGSIKMEFDFDAIEDEDSPYPEVRASVSNIDDPDMPAMTIRMWFVGLLLCMTSSAFNVFFNFRSPAPSIIPLVLLLLSYPVGKFLAFTLPITTYRIPLPCFPARWVPSSTPRVIMRFVRPMTFPHAIEFSLNPGPWNIKEHVLVFIMANVAVGNPYALNAIVVLEKYYKFETNYWFSLVLVLATQLTGFGLAGMCRRFLVWPASMVWPQNLVACTLLNTLHAEDEDDGIGMLGGPTSVTATAASAAAADGSGSPQEAGGVVVVKRKKGMSRYRFFVLTTAGSFVFFFLPGYLFEALSFFSFVCWAAPNNVQVNQMFGVRSGLGMSVLTFDWTQISWIGSPLMVPWWAEVHIFAGFVLFYWIMTPILYYTNSWKLAHFPISANGPYDRYGLSYNISSVIKEDGTFNLEAYKAYSPLFLPATYAMTYLLAFCLSTCVIVHTLLYHGHTLLAGFKKMRVENDDIHAKLMRNYPEVPDWWYASAFVAFFALAIVAVEVWDTSVPVWALLLSVALPVIYILPSGFIYAMTGQGINLNILAQIIPGTLLPGQPLANMVFKAYSVQTLAEATSFVQDLKLGHYVKVPPRATFLVQLVATTLAAFVQVGVKQWIFDNVHDICEPEQASQLTCPHNQVFYTASAVWGLIGPTRQFGVGSIYHWHLYAIIVGAVLPIPFWFWRRKYPNSWVKWVSTPVVLNGVAWIPPATGINYSSWFAVGFAFQYVVRKRNFAWWSKFNYVLSSALDSGTVIAVMVIFFTLQFPKTKSGGNIEVRWWGNTVHRETADWKSKPWLKIPDGGIVVGDF